MFHSAIEHPNCYCLVSFIKKQYVEVVLQIFPSDFTNERDRQGFNMSCSNNKHTCAYLDSKLDGDDYNADGNAGIYYRIDYPKCISETELDTNKVLKRTKGTDIFQCGKHCKGNLYAVMKDGFCYCGEKDLFLKDNNSFMTNIKYDKCDRCPTKKKKNVVNGTSPEEFSPYTCGTASVDKPEDNMYSVYCSDKKKCLLSESKDEETKFAYFACIGKLDQTTVTNLSRTPSECFTLCKDYKSVYMKPMNNSHLECVCDNTPNVTMHSLATGCESTWSPGVSGSIGNNDVRLNKYNP